MLGEKGVWLVNQSTCLVRNECLVKSQLLMPLLLQLIYPSCASFFKPLNQPNRLAMSSLQLTVSYCNDPPSD